MAAATGIPKQDMPPPGGYPKIFYQRTFPKISVNWWKLGGGMTFLFAYGGYIFVYLQRKAWGQTIESQDVANALYPFMKAESDRMWLLMVRRLRDEENEAMKGVAGWQTGTWFGEPIYFTVPRGRWYCPSETDIFPHSGKNEYEHGKHFKRHTDSVDLPAWYDKFTPRVPWSDLV